MPEKPTCEECWTGDDRPCYRCSECIAYAMAQRKIVGHVRISREFAEDWECARIDGDAGA